MATKSMISRRWVATFIAILVVTLIVQILVPTITRLIVENTASAADQRFVYGLLTMAIIKAAVPVIGMLVLMVAAIMRSRRTKQRWGINVLLIVAIVGSIPFYSNLVVINPLERFVGVGALMFLSVTLSAIIPLVLICWMLRKEGQWAPKHPWISNTILTVTIVANLYYVLTGIGGVLAISMWLTGSASGIAGMSQSLAAASVLGGVHLPQFLTFATSLLLAWALFADDKRKPLTPNNWMRPIIAIPAVLALIIGTWQWIYPMSTANQMLSTERYARAIRTEKMFVEMTKDRLSSSTRIAREARDTREAQERQERNAESRERRLIRDAKNREEQLLRQMAVQQRLLEINKLRQRSAQEADSRQPNGRAAMNNHCAQLDRVLENLRNNPNVPNGRVRAVQQTRDRCYSSPAAMREMPQRPRIIPGPPEGNVGMKSYLDR